MDKKTVPNDVLLEEAATLLGEGREVVLSPRGQSMLPFIREGRDAVVLKLRDDVQVGDIVLARLPGRYVLHRVFGVEGGRLTLMGDGNVGLKEHCGKEDILGTVVAIERGEKTIIPGKGSFWRALLPVRRYILAIYRRLI